MMNTLVYGIEGESWEKVGDKHLKFLDGYKEGFHMAKMEYRKLRIITSTRKCNNRNDRKT
ncbi:hypothetical protein MGH68_01560 [Erysipelothrix sp. D19-032]